MANFDLLNWLSNTLNYAIFAFLSINLVGTNCFNQSQLFLTAFGLFASIILQLIYLIVRRI